MECRSIVMNHTVPPSVEDLESIAVSVWENLPDEIMRHCGKITVVIEDFVDDTTLGDLGMEDPFELLALYKSGKEISPGVERKVANDDDILVLYRRSVLDMWCDTEYDLEITLRQVMIEELGRYFDFAEDDIQEMTERHC